MCVHVFVLEYVICVYNTHTQLFYNLLSSVTISKEISNVGQSSVYAVRLCVITLSPPAALPQPVIQRHAIEL